ncbi:hypothetical protein KUCAC02_017611 [Chaenocephalus aceratus]|uniref:Uncharacterized protein n=1 Tax=Chaenocephalus aceratus TaxID=36190 RepID=A0ACB9W1Q9_CHAAC|nr:hypothetical protein KUCAC02_017611 [Chaenocephalus aceratus]
MPLINNKVGDDGTVGKDKALVDGKALVDSLIKVVACYRVLATCVGGCTDSLQLRDELRQTREKAQRLAMAIRSHLTSHLRDKSLPEEQRKEMEILWVGFSSSLELLHVDMCKVFNMGDIFSLSKKETRVQNGLQGGGSEVAARALSVPDLNQPQSTSLPAEFESHERSTMEKDISQLDHMIDDMEMKVNVLRWMVEPHGPQYPDPLSSTDSASLLSVDEEQPGHQPLHQRLSTSIPALQYLDRSVPKSEGGKLLFDTHAVVRLFEENGFTTQQAEVIVKILVKMTTSNMDVIYSDMVTKVQQEIMLQRLMSQIASVKKDMLILEKSEFSTLLAENEKLKNELMHIKIQLADVMNKLRSDTIMDMNLEKSRSKELALFRVFYATMADAFSSSSENVIQRVVDVTVGESNPVEKLEELYQIKDICGFITEHQFEKVALQFPDELLVDAVAVALEIERNSNAKPFILGDTSYGSCCVDEVAAEHVGADCIVHYGSACLSPSKRLPLMYVFERRPVDLEKCTSAFRELYPDTHSHIIILYDVNYVHAIDDLMALLSPEYPNLVVSQLVVEGEQCYSHGRTESVSINRALMKRYYAIERAKDANVVGILVGTLGVSDYLKIIQQLKEAIHGAGKKSYLFAMGKLNVPKLANFLEIDIFVLIACPENSLLDSSEFYKPVVTPFEMEVACNRKREWSEEYVTDFRHLLPGGQSHVPLADQQEEGSETDMSLITGALRSQNLMSSEPEVSSFGSSVVLRNQMLTVANTNSAASFLAERSWRGLEQNLGATPVVKAVEGRRGIAIAYEEEG